VGGLLALNLEMLLELFDSAECNAALCTDKTVCISFMRPIGRVLAEIFEYFAAQIFYSRGGTASSNPGKLRLRFGL
jgi:hypothetical protein